MSLIDDVIGKKLPSGRKFQAKVGAGNFKNKLYIATRNGVLSNLADNQEIINKIAAKRQSKIRAGAYSKDLREADFQEAVKSDNLSADDKKDLRAILEHWGRSKTDGSKVTKVKNSSVASQRAKAADERIRPAPKRELPKFLKNRAQSSINKNPWTDNMGGSGGGIGAGINQGRATRKPTLLK